MTQGSSKLADVIRQFAPEQNDSPFVRGVMLSKGSRTQYRVDTARGEVSAAVSLDEAAEEGDDVVVVQLSSGDYIILGRV